MAKGTGLTEAETEIIRLKDRIDELLEANLNAEGRAISAHEKGRLEGLAEASQIIQAQILVDKGGASAAYRQVLAARTAPEIGTSLGSHRFRTAEPCLCGAEEGHLCRRADKRCTKPPAGHAALAERGGAE